MSYVFLILAAIGFVSFAVIDRTRRRGGAAAGAHATTDAS